MASDALERTHNVVKTWFTLITSDDEMRSRLSSTGAVERESHVRVHLDITIC